MKRILILLGFALTVVIAYPADTKEVKRTFDNLTINSTYAVKMDVVDLLNQVRLENGAEEVSTQYVLADGAQAWSAELVNDFDHDKRQSTGKFKGEVILMYEGELRPERIISEFLNSRPHRNTILSKQFKNVGVGIKIVGNNNFVVVRFG